ncbi:hypothetical protein V2G26_012289 [Clonostachys chloroleuca]
MKADDLISQSQEAKFLNYPNNDRWTHLKPVIVPLYMDCRDTSGKAMTCSKVAAFMKLNYNFHAAVPIQGLVHRMGHTKAHLPNREMRHRISTWQKTTTWLEHIQRYPQARKFR